MSSHLRLQTSEARTFTTSEVRETLRSHRAEAEWTLWKEMCVAGGIPMVKCLEDADPNHDGLYEFKDPGFQDALFVQALQEDAWSKGFWPTLDDAARQLNFVPYRGAYEVGVRHLGEILSSRRANWKFAGQLDDVGWHALQCVLTGGASGVRVLDIAQCNLAGPDLPSTLQLLAPLASTLVTLDMNGNPMGGDIPNAIGSFTALTSLSLSGMRLNGTLPLCLIHMKARGCKVTLFDNVGLALPSDFADLADDITRLDLSNCSLVGDVNDSAFGRLCRLDLFNFEGNAGLIQKTAPGFLACNYANLKDAKAFDAHDKELTGPPLPHLLRLLFPSAPRLEDLNLSKNPLGGDLAGISRFTSLTSLNLARMNLEGELPIELIRMKARGCLVILAQNKGLTLPHNFCGFDGVSLIDLTRCSLCGELPVSLIRMKARGCEVLLAENLGLTLPENFGELREDACPLGVFTSFAPLDLSVCSLIGDVPSELIQMKADRFDILLSDNIGLVLRAANIAEQVTEMDLSCCSLCGDISDDLFARLARLDRFDISGNPMLNQDTLLGHLVCQYSNLTNARQLEVNFRGVSGPISSAISACASLTKLHLVSNKLTGELPLTLIRMKARGCDVALAGNYGLTLPPNIDELGDDILELDLSCCSLIGTVPEAIGKLVRLTYLGLDDNKLTGIIPLGIGRLKAGGCEVGLAGNKLGLHAQYGTITDEVLDFSNCSCEGSIPNELLRLGHRVKLLSNTALKLPPDIGELADEPALCIELGHHNLAGTLPRQLGKLSQLRVLALDMNKLTGIIPEQICSMWSLEIFHLSGNQLHGANQRAR